MASIELPDRATTAYLRECGGAAIYIVADGSGSCILGASVDLAAALAAVRKCDGNFHAVLAAVWWAPRHHVAQLIEIARREVAPVPVSARDVTTVTAAVERASRQMGLRLTDHGVAMARAKAAVEPLSGKVKPATDGDLRDFELKANGARIVLSTCPPTAEESTKKG
jgi:hypothetical protein